MTRQLSEAHKQRIREGMAKAAKANQLTGKEEGKKVGTKPKQLGAGTPVPDALSTLLGSISEQVSQQIDASVEAELAVLREEVKKNQKLDITIDSKTNTVKGMRHAQLEDLIRVAALRLSTLMVGMAGTGKTHATEQVAEALGLPYYTMSVGAQTSKSDIIGFMNANGGYVRTLFREAYENGGVFLMDEIDAGNANVLIQVNAALSNGLAAFPDNKMVKKHKNFVFVASANTYGTGMNRQYVGRNQLDAATLDRFTILDWEIDDELEQKLATGVSGLRWYTVVKGVRKHVADHNIRALVTPRSTQKGSLLLANQTKVESVIPMVLLGSIPDDKKPEITKLAMDIWNSKEAQDAEKKS